MRSEYIHANGIKHHILRINETSEDVILILHGYLDNGSSFEKIGTYLAETGFQIIIPDFRGHGRSDKAPLGSYYHFADYVADIFFLLEELSINKINILAHSMGGSVASIFSGIFPDRVNALMLLEGIGPPKMPPEIAPDRTKQWLFDLKRQRKKEPRVYKTINDVASRLQFVHSNIAEDVLIEVAKKSVRQSDEGYCFLFDPLHQTTSPSRFDAEAFEEYVSLITCPVLVVDGGGMENFPEFESRVNKYKNLRRITIQNAGHMMHWTQPVSIAWLSSSFFSDPHNYSTI